MASSTMRLSASLHFIPLESVSGRFLVYAPLRQSAFVANRAAVQSLERLCEGRPSPDLDPGGPFAALLRRLEILDAGDEPSPASRACGEPRPVSLTLLLTTACNLRCSYCYASAGEAPPEFMGRETALRAIDYIFSNAAIRRVSEVEVMFHGGGEPTLNWPVLQGAVDYARARAAASGVRLFTSTATNGVLSDGQLDWLCRNLDHATVSFDGLPACHDANRRDVRGRGTSQRVMHSLRRLDRAGLSYGVRLTVTPAQVRRLPDSVEWILATFHPAGILVEPVYRMGRWSGRPSPESLEFLEAFRQAKDRARPYGRPVGFSGARVGLLTNHFCGVSRDSFAVAPSGSVTACYEVFSETRPWASTFFYARPDAGSGYEFNLPVLNHLRNLSVESKPHCRQCFARWTCAGDCAYQSLCLQSDGESLPGNRCHIIRELTKDMILERIEASGGPAWHGDRPKPADGRPHEALCA
ncbi:MAG: radical SAM protein [Bryobacterales bacterium]|nr:radical SAM protein [Bryobacterales bacterium]